ncbi:MAG: 2-amino-4-hydroxy-6-hydroxymethyldihydropteridine diphosphokinase [Candidatus Saccharicenans sp.]|nr:MAG: 2-amino-4-hydroxy-6-hydroxymethyldihydropteridine diphosphokinase [Candidatus Aminicenantes bacterium]HEK86685.1 2-amino-4-hydroxy-6-hydroxymethyldihydropteridine diphosphokinase [Candidatus Aminicenantes bacterium]
MRYFISIGSNVGDRGHHLAQARRLLSRSGIKIIRQSSVYETEPVDYPDQPWFYNQVLEIESPHQPVVLLNLLKDIEQRMKRQPTFDKGPRIIDLDILLAEKTVIQTQKLVIPHPRMSFRNFVMIPLAEIAPDFVHPIFHQTIAVLAGLTGDTSLVRKIEPAEQPSIN